MRSSWWLAVALLGCGDENKIPDAGVPDAYQHDAPEVPSCAPGETTCNASCADLMTSEQYCGDCDTRCAQNFACVAGSCVSANTSCARVREVDPQAPDGAYQNPNDGRWFYCDFAAGVTIDEIFVSPYTAAPAAGYEVAHAATFADPIFVKAFVAMYNQNGGHRAKVSFQTTDCCMGPAVGARYRFAGEKLYTATAPVGIFCNQLISANTHVLFAPGGDAPEDAPLPADYFTTHPVTEGADCSDGGNAAWWFRRRNTLD